MKRICIGLVGDFSEKIHTHRALNNAIEHCRKRLDFHLEPIWISTISLTENTFSQNKFHGCWIVPGSPYRNDRAVYDSIRWARENDFPLLGSCGGFQYMIIEYIKNVLGVEDAAHEESEPNADIRVITKLSCSLKGREEEVLITDKGSRLFTVFNAEKIMGRFYCSYGLNPKYQQAFDGSAFLFTAFSADGEARACELKSHPYFNGTLFQPSLDSTAEQPNPLILDFFRACDRLS